MSNQVFHPGEIQLQQRTGMRDVAEKIGQAMVRDYMPEQHREFFAGLEYIFLGVATAEGEPRGILLTGPAGFISSPAATMLTLQLNDSLPEQAALLQKGVAVGVLGIDLSCRRRNRMHGEITSRDEASLTITVRQSYGNCPKYINLRDIFRRVPVNSAEFHTADSLQGADAEAVRQADTCFITSVYPELQGNACEGVDISHRGGVPGFVKLVSPDRLIIPDYKGNNLFNTLGNLLVQPAVALLFPDFSGGDQLHVYGRAEICDETAQLQVYPGAQRLLIIQVNEVVRMTGATPIRWKAGELSPFNPGC